MKSLSIIDSLRPFSVGFDNMFKHFEDLHSNDLDAFETNRVNYNITKVGKQDYNIEVALPGVDQKDVNVSVEDNILKIKSFSKNKVEKDDKEYLYKNIHKNIFTWLCYPWCCISGRSNCTDIIHGKIIRQIF